MDKGSLYIVATPIGNLADISPRAVDTLKQVGLIAAEDTRRTRKLLSALGIQQKLVSLHDHNERSRVAGLIDTLQRGQDIALVSDAGTPMISDPGFHLIRAVQEAGLAVVPMPGPSAVITALSAAGLPANRFYFAGFLPERRQQRQTWLQSLAAFTDTLVFFETGVRLADTLQDMISIFGLAREAVICRELTKLYESIDRDTLEGLQRRVAEEQIPLLGEFVLVVAGAKKDPAATFDRVLVERLLQGLLPEMPLGRCATLIAGVLGCPRKQVYELGLQLKNRTD